LHGRLKAIYWQTAPIILLAIFLENRRLKAKKKILEKQVKFWKNSHLRTVT